MATPAELAALRSRVGGILMSPQCQRINFTYGGAYMDGSAYSYIALATLSKPGHGVNVKVNPFQSSEAMYLPDTNSLVFKTAGYGSAAQPFEMMTVVHESGHALHDAKKQRLSMLINEFCCYTAGALFNQFRADAGLPFFDGLSQPAGGIYREAHQLAAKMSRVMKRFNYADCYNIMTSDAEATALAGAIRASSTRYNKDDSYGENGVRL